MCDTFVALRNSTEDGSVIFGKNSDRPQSEVQIVTYSPRKTHAEGEKLRCTYITIPQVKETAEIILSQPFWMWGSEMGVSEHGVAIGNEAVYTKEPLRETGLLGMDLLRLGLERGKTAKEALNVITKLLEMYGQGGNCAFDQQGWSYHNSFIIADKKEAYVLDTADKWWVAEIVKDVRSISNNISIRGKGDLRREGIINHAIKSGYCKDEKDFDFALIFSDPQIPERFPPNTRDGCSLRMLNEAKGKISVEKMMSFLREHDVGICMHGAFQSTGSQVSWLRDDNQKSVHWFTAGTIPCLNIYKPYVFPANTFNIMKPGPYEEINPDWFWAKHSAHIKPYKRVSKKPAVVDYLNELRTRENALISQVKEVISKEKVLSDEDLVLKIKEINKTAWKESKEMIDLK